MTTAASHLDDHARHGRRIRCLVVEDEAIIAMMLKFVLEEADVEVVGPVGDLDEAITTATTARFDVAILDIAISGGDVFPAADLLKDRGIPFAFHTGHGTRSEVEGRYSGAPLIKKPAESSDLVDFVYRTPLAAD